MARVTSLLLFALLSVSGSALAQDHSLRSSGRVSLVFGADFGGEGTVHVDSDLIDDSQSFDLDASPVVGLRFTSPMSTYFSLGAQFLVTRWRFEDTDDRNTLLDFSVVPAARYVFDVGSIELEPYVGVPLGFTVNIFNEEPADALGLDKANLGFGIGILGGLSVNTPMGIGGFFELGWSHHQVFEKGEGDARYRLTMNQLAMHFGVTYAF